MNETNNFNYSHIFKLHSQTILSFLANLRLWTKEIVTKELHLEMPRSRIHYKGTMFPLTIVVFEHPTRLGYFQDNLFELGINKYLMSEAKPTVIKNILRHELMHFLTFIEFGDQNNWMGGPHGEEFQLMCRRFAFDSPDILRAKSHIQRENQQLEGDLKNERLIEKVKKLFNLALSDNPHEAELATQKANELLLKHNLELLNQDYSLDDLDLYVKCIYQAPKLSAKMRALRSIIETFLVYPIFNCGKGVSYLEVTGSRTNVLMADYIANFLDLELERLWDLHRKKNKNLSGLRNKNSFFMGIASGYCEKVEKSREEQYSGIEQKALICLKNNLEEQTQQFYPHLRGISRGNSINQKALAQGILAGKNDLTIRRPLEDKSSKKSGLALLQ